jgi:TetR/AcrR family transcriptional repressor of lmrAB and yxaGH operons
MPRPSDARSRFIDTAAVLFRQRGYHGVGLSEIIEAAQAPKGSFYHHFPGGKEELAGEAVRRAGRAIGRTLDQVFEQSPSFEAGALTLATMIAGWFEGSDWSAGCPVTTVLLDTTPASPALSVATREVFEDWITKVAGHAERLSAAGDPRERAIKLLVGLEGAWIVARTLRSAEPFRLAAAMA